MIAAEPQDSRPVHVIAPIRPVEFGRSRPPGVLMPRSARHGLLAALLSAAATLSLAASAADADAVSALRGASQSNDEFVDVEQAFKVNASATAPDRIEVNFVVLKGYYLYRA